MKKSSVLVWLLLLLITSLSGVSLARDLQRPSPPPKIVIDRFEGDFAVLEIGDYLIDVPTEALPLGLREGAELRFTLVDAPENKRARARLRSISGSATLR